MTLLCRSKKLTRFDYHYKNNHDISNKCINVLRPDDYAYEICVTQMLSLTRLQNFEFKYLSPLLVKVLQLGKENCSKE